MALTNIPIKLKRKIINLKIIVLLFFASTSCQNKLMQTTPFILAEASYQTWMETPQNKGTDIVIALTHVNSSIIFDSLVFRRAKVPVSAGSGKDTVIVKAYIPDKGSISPVSPQYIDAPNQLIYRLKDNRYTLPLKKLKRRNTNYVEK